MTDGAARCALPALDRDVLKLLFRNILAQKAVRNYAGTHIAKLAAINKVCLDEIGHVTNRFRTSTLTFRGMALERDCQDPAIVVTAPQFVWLAQWDMLHLKDLTIACGNAREWQAFVEHFKIPSLDTLRYAVPLHKPRSFTDNSSLELAADIVKLNASSIKELDAVPVWKLSEPLPALQLKLFVYSPHSWNDLSNLSECVVDVLEVYLERCPEEQVPLDILAEVNVTKVVFHASCIHIGDFSAAEGATNKHVRRVHFKLDRTSVSVQDVEVLRRFLPNLTGIQIDADLCNCKRGRGVRYLSNLQQIGQHLASGPAMPSLQGRVQLAFIAHWWETRKWTAENVLDECERVQEARDAIAQVPPQLRVWASVDATFHRTTDAETEEADKQASELGFDSESFVTRCGLRAGHNLKIDLGPARKLHLHWTVYERSW
ncbi:hypothetical protein AAVH_01204 [Aphelenchoides avenae]|nr:hypothetical protein AAVH_01204 [Aphelenchus avenae]